MTAHAQSPSTFGAQRTSIPSGAGRIGEGDLPTPKTPEACDRLLDYFDEQRAFGAEALASQLVRYLGASGAAWTRPRRRRLSELLMSTPDGLREVLATVFEAPTAEVVSHAEECLQIGATPERRDLYAGLLEGAPIGIAGLRVLRSSADVRIVLARALGRVEEPLTESELRALVRAAGDPCEDVREAAVLALGDRGGDHARAALVQLRNGETAPLVRDAIDEALDARR